MVGDPKVKWATHVCREMNKNVNEDFEGKRNARKFVQTS